MQFETALLWSWLNIVSPKRYTALVERFGSMDKAVQHIDEELLLQLGCRNDTTIKTLNRMEDFAPDAYALQLQKRGLQLITCEDAQYPQTLKTIPDAPVFLYYTGNLSILDQPCVAIVGTRTMTAYGKRITEEWVPQFIGAGMVTVSGLAEGIDSVVAQESLRSGGATVAVLGHGLGMISPKSKERLAESIAAQGGLVISEYALDVPADTFTFPARNRIIAGLSSATLVIEAGEKSGALITANLALEYNRDVFAVPGLVYEPMSHGCNTLIAKGEATLVTSAQEVLQHMGIVASQRAASEFVGGSPDETLLWSLLTTMPQSVTQLQERSNLQTGAINAALTMMELQGAAKNAGGGSWVRS